MYLLEFENLENSSFDNLVYLNLPLRVDIDTQVSGDKDDYVDKRKINEIVENDIKELFDPILTELDKNNLVKIQEFDTSCYDASYITISCKEENLEQVKDFLRDIVKRNLKTLEHEEEYDLDVEGPWEDAWDSSFGHYTRSISFRDEDDAYDWYHATVYFNISLTFDESSMEVY